MTDSEVRDYLQENGYPEHLIKEGRVGLIRRWREFVERVERGYNLGLEDYRNDLDIRGILRLAGAEDKDVLALDDRLRAQLIPARRRIWESAPVTSGNAPFWDFGYPRNAGEELLEGLRAENLLES